MSDEETQGLSETENDFTECIAVLEFQSRYRDSDLEIPLYPEKELRIGRERGCNYVIMDDRVSKQHFRVYSVLYEKAQRPTVLPLIYCEDLESFNGTYINDVLIGKIGQEKIGHLLCDGDIIEIRPFWKFKFHQTISELVVRSTREWEDLEHLQDSYTVTDRKLGSGKYGNVYLAKELATTKQVACKIIDLELAMQQLSDFQSFQTTGKRWKAGIQCAKEEKSRVMREIKILANISHPNIINLKKAFYSNRALYIFTELAPAGDLFSHMVSHGGRLDDHQSRIITRQVALAIQFLHSNGIAHRDIKPENVLVTNTHFGGRVILTDFGFATRINVGTGRMLSKLGTDGYVAPEVEAVEETNIGYTKAADLWSLGVLTACLFTGDVVIPREDLAELSQVEIAVRFLGMNDEYARGRWLNIPERALNFIQRLLVVNPEERMSIDEALDHSWYTRPRREYEALNDALNRLTRFWRPREKNDVVLKGFPGVITNRPIREQPAAKLHRTVPDASLSPYFGLDRHLQPKLPSTRKRILDILNESGSQFVAPKEHTEKNAGKTAGSRDVRGASSIRSVEGTDLFGMSVESNSGPLFESDLDEVDQVTTRSLLRVEKGFGFNLSDPTDSLISSMSAYVANHNQVVEIPGKRPRKYSDTGTSEKLLRLGTAGALRGRLD